MIVPACGSLLVKDTRTGLSGVRGGEVLSEQARQLSNRKTNFRIPGYKSELFPGLISKSKKPQLFRFWAGGKTSPPRFTQSAFTEPDLMQEGESRICGGGLFGVVLPGGC